MFVCLARHSYFKLKIIINFTQIFHLNIKVIIQIWIIRSNLEFDWGFADCGFLGFVVKRILTRLVSLLLEIVHVQQQPKSIQTLGI